VRVDAHDLAITAEARGGHDAAGRGLRLVLDGAAIAGLSEEQRLAVGRDLEGELGRRRRRAGGDQSAT
jgi:hypothetical protein